jgi:hypothetical protein
MWLPQFVEVLAFHFAPRHLGSTATVVHWQERMRAGEFRKHSGARELGAHRKPP